MRKSIDYLGVKLINTEMRIKDYLKGQKGDVSTNAIGGIILGVVFIGLAVTAINKFFPNFFSTMFNNMQTKLTKNW